MSSKKNRHARMEIERRYGKGCMLEQIQDKIERTGIKTYRQYISEIRFSGPKVEQLRKLMTYHHLKHKSDGGPATVENGAEVSALGQMYIHSLPRHQEEIVNNMLRDYKYQIDSGKYEKIGIEFVDTECTKYMEELGYVVNAAEIIPERDLKRKQKFSRSKVKEETRRLVEEEEIWR